MMFIEILAMAEYRYADENGWETIIDEFVTDPTLYDGVIARATKALTNQPKPVINIWFNSPVKDKLPGVFPDYCACGKIRAEHFLDRGFRNFGSLIRRGLGAWVEADAFKNTVEDKGFSCLQLEVAADPSKTEAIWQKSEEAISAWMDRWILPCGVHVSSGYVGRLIAQKCRARGWRVPEDVGIVAGQNETSICESPHPSLSSVEMGFERIGYEAAKMLDGFMRSKSVPESEHLFIPPQGLIVRESTDFYSIKDPLVGAALEFISLNSHRNIGQDDVAVAVATETRTLQNRFRKTLDRPIAATIRQVRLDQAKRELTQSNRSISQIAIEVGFSSPERLNEVFRRELGVSPTEYRLRRKAWGDYKKSKAFRNLLDFKLFNRNSDLFFLRAKNLKLDIPAPDSHNHCI